MRLGICFYLKVKKKRPTFALFVVVLPSLPQDLAVITDADFQVLLDELLAYEAVGKFDAIVA